MSMYPQPIAPLPAETKRLAWSVNPKGTLIMRVRDRLGSLSQDKDFVAVYSATRQPAFAPWRLALIIVFEYLEGLTDRQVAQAARNRLDWKYALSLPVDRGYLDSEQMLASRHLVPVVAGVAWSMSEDAAHPGDDEGSVAHHPGGAFSLTLPPLSNDERRKRT